MAFDFEFREGDTRCDHNYTSSAAGAVGSDKQQNHAWWHHSGKGGSVDLPSED